MMVLHDRFARFLCLLTFFFWLFLFVYKYYNLGYYDWDLAFFAQGMWGLSHGSYYVSLFDINFFANHANLIAYLLAPFYKIFPHPLHLLILKLISFFMASYVLYLLAKEKLGPAAALLVLCLYWIYPANLYALVYEFDFESLAPVFLMLMFYCYVRGQWKAFIIHAVFLILIKENMPLIVAFFGVHGLLTKADKWRWGLVPMISGVLSFYILSFVFVPLMGGHKIGQHPYLVHYVPFLKHPWESLHSFMSVEKLKLAWQLLAPLIFLPLWGPGILFLVTPIMLQHLLSATWQEHSIFYAYTLTLTPFIFLAFIHALAGIKQRFPEWIFPIVLLAAIFSTGRSLWMELPHIKARHMDSRLVKEAPYRWQLLKMVPVQASVIATFNFLPELSQRPYLYAFYKAHHYFYRFYKLPKDIQYALIDFNDPWLLSSLRYRYVFTKQRVQDFLSSGWILEKRYGDVVLYKRKGSKC